MADLTPKTKVIKWFKEGDKIPIDAKFLNTETRIVEQDSDDVGVWDVYANGAIYEIPVTDNVSEDKKKITNSPCPDCRHQLNLTTPDKNRTQFLVCSFCTYNSLYIKTVKPDNVSEAQE